MARIPTETIDRIRDAADIVDVVGDYVQLKRKGQNWFGLCPFHQETAPSFSVNQKKQIFYCFGCGKGGGVFNFIMEVDKLDFVEAVQRLGQKVGIPVELTGHDDPRQKATVQQIFELYERATELYQKNLNSSTGDKVCAYLTERGISEATRALFKIGYVPEQWEQLTKQIKGQGFSRQAVTRSGLFMEGEKGIYDRFRGRIMFPIANRSGRTVALAGRVFETDDAAKYMNSPETPIYHKSEVLYGLHLTRDFIRDNETVIIVEGYLDLIQLYQAGIKEVVAISGTALTDSHARELRKLTTAIYLAYDGDKAGIQAAVRGGYTLLRNGLNPKVVELPAGVDPDDWVKRDGPEPFRAAMKQALSLLKFQHKNYEGDLGDAGVLRRFLDDTLAELARIPDPLAQELALKQLSDLTGLDERRLQEVLANLRQRQRRRGAKGDSPAGTQPAIIEPTRINRAQQSLIQLAFSDDEDVLKLLAGKATPGLFTDPFLRQIWEQLHPLLTAGAKIEAAAFIEQLESEEERAFLSQILMGMEKSASNIVLAVDCLVVLNRDLLQQKIEVQRQELRQAEKAGEAPPLELLSEVARLQADLAGLEGKFQAFRAKADHGSA